MTEIKASEFTCPLCGGFRWGSSRLGDGTLMRSCSERIKLSDGSLGYCRFTWHQDADHLFLRLPSDETPGPVELRAWNLLGVTREQALFLRRLQEELRSIEAAKPDGSEMWSQHMQSLVGSLSSAAPPDHVTIARFVARLAAYGLLLTREATRRWADKESIWLK